PPACGVTGTETAQRFLASAYDSVEAVLMTRETLLGIRRTQGGDVRGRLTSPEEDQLRAAIVLTGAGLDVTVKQLIRDTLVHRRSPSVIATLLSSHARRSRDGDGDTTLDRQPAAT